ncbi:MAG TPA: trehalose-phosphatase [Methylomirabilota bacterium]|jgi:trehalose-phosphatase|nr:trehalose-phosphatase [Methylomirabilota bacterium]
MSDAPRIVSWLDDWLAGGGRLLLLLDYDGTLTPIVETPHEASLPGTMRDDLRALAGRPNIRVAVLSGRDLADLRERVGVSGLIYAGCHGLEIEGPDVTFCHPEAEAQQETLGVIGEQLNKRAPTVPGMLVEPKRFGLAVHYRHVARDQIRRVETELARAIQQGGSRLKIFHGSQVIEIQPQVSWNKGDCVIWIRDAVQRMSTAPLMVLYIGDDWTDEHAFEALAGQGITVRVGTGVPASRAAYRFPDVAEVQRLVGTLAARPAGGTA